MKGKRIGSRIRMKSYGLRQIVPLQCMSGWGIFVKNKNKNKHNRERTNSQMALSLSLTLSCTVFSLYLWEWSISIQYSYLQSKMVQSAVLHHCTCHFILLYVQALSWKDAYLKEKSFLVTGNSQHNTSSSRKPTWQYPQLKVRHYYVQNQKNQALKSELFIG